VERCYDVQWFLASAVATAALAAPAAGAPTCAFTLHASVSRVVDGDTVHVQLRSGRDERVRLIGIDTPEIGECDAGRATALAQRLAAGRAATLIGDPTQATRDRYGRLLAYVVVPGAGDLGYRELAQGYARVYVYRPFTRLTLYRRAARIGRTKPDSLARACGG
jgi:micrococcal nuclease